MASDRRRLIDRLEKRIRTSDALSDEDRDVLLAFSDALDALGQAEYGDDRHEELLRHCTRIAEEVGGLSDSLEDEDAVEQIVPWIDREYDDSETNRDYRVAPRVFGTASSNATPRRTVPPTASGGFPRRRRRTTTPPRTTAKCSTGSPTWSR